jgi:hypothetical protein
MKDTLSLDKDSKSISFFRTANSVFLEAQKNAAPVYSYYSIGGYTIKLHFAGSALVPQITPSLEHLVAPQNSSSALTIYLWDSESTKTFMPTPPWSIDDYTARGEVLNYTDENIFTACHKSSGALSILDKNRNEAFWWIRNASNVPFYESGSPLLMILHWWLQKKGLQVVHAGAVGTKEAGVLLIGRGGSGKSSTTLTCLKSELFYVGDDYCLVSTNSVPFVFSLYNSGKLNADHINKFPHLLPLISNSNYIQEEKALLFLNKHYPSKMINGFLIKGILLPRITGLPETSLTPSSPATALKTFAPNTLFQLSYANHSAFHEIAKFVRQLPCYYLNLGTELNEIPKTILRFLYES